MTKEEILDSNYNKNLGFLSITYEQVLKAMEQYANHKAIEVAGDSWDAGQARLMYESSCEGFEPDRETYLLNLKKNIEA